MPSRPIIAVVDDDASIRDALSDFLELHSMSCRLFERAEAFLDVYAPGRFDCLLTDLRMPGMGGLELQRALKSRGSSMPVIVVTSSLNPESQQRAMELGAFAYLIKPVSHDVLLEQLKAALGLWSPRTPNNGKPPPTG